MNRRRIEPSSPDSPPDVHSELSKIAGGFEERGLTSGVGGDVHAYEVKEPICSIGAKPD